MECTAPVSLNISCFDYHLPDSMIAEYPLSERDSSKLLVWRGGGIEEDRFRNVSRYLPERSLLVLNDSRVIPARIFFSLGDGSSVEVFCLEPYEPASYAKSLSSSASCVWRCLVGKSRRWKGGIISSVASQGPYGVSADRSYSFIDRPAAAFVYPVASAGRPYSMFGRPPARVDSTPRSPEQLAESGASIVAEVCIPRLYAERLSVEGDTCLVRFSWDDPLASFSHMLDLCGTVPIPPYLGRSATDRDRDSYGTVYCKHSGSVAAPTAGLHFSKSVFSSLTVKRILRSSVTLHVGAGTFKPVRSETIGGHVMHSEWFSVNRGLVVRLLENEGRIVAAGTTSVRTLESLYHIGASLFADPGFNPESFSVGQWSPYGVDGCGFRESFSSVLDYMDRNGLSKLSARTSILIAPGYRFRVVSGMITNFHQPRSTLLLLVSAFTGGAWREIYDHALARNYRFLSYGDTSLLLP